MSFRISGGTRLTGGFRFAAASASSIGSTASTATPTLNGSVTVGTTNGSPFTPAVNNYVIPAPSSVPPYNTASTPGVSGLNFGTGAFTIEWFQYQTDSNSFPRSIWYATGSTLHWGISIEGTFYFWNTSPNAIATSGQLGSFKNAWTHFAVVRSGGVIKLYKNGTQVGSNINNTANMTTTTGTLYIGGKPYGSLTSEQFGGSITSVRICKIAVYTGNFTRPTSPLGQTQSANPYGGSNTAAITAGQCAVLLNP